VPTNKTYINHYVTLVYSILESSNSKNFLKTF
jgi:hypothetical protein